MSDLPVHCPRALYMLLYIEPLLHPWWGLKLQTLQCGAFVFLFFRSIQAAVSIALRSSHYCEEVMRNMKRWRDWWDEAHSQPALSRKTKRGVNPQMADSAQTENEAACAWAWPGFLTLADDFGGSIHPKTAPKAANGGPSSLARRWCWLAGAHTLSTQFRRKTYTPIHCTNKKLHGDERMMVT